MKKLFQSKIFWVGAVIFIIAVSLVIRFSQGGPKVDYVTQPVALGDLVQTVSATGQVKSASEIELNFQNTGQLAVLAVKTGQAVAAGQILAQLKATDLALEVNKAGSDLQEAQANLDKIIAGSTEPDLAVSQAAVAKAQTDLINAQSDLTNTEKTYRQELENKRQSILVDLNTALTKANISLQVVYDTLNYKGDEKNFTTSNFALEQVVNNGHTSALAKVALAQAAYNAAQTEPQDDKIDQAAKAGLAALDQTETTLDDLNQLLDYVITTSVLTRSELDTIKSNVNSERITTDSSLNTVKTAEQDLADARVNYQAKVEAAENAVAVAERNLAKVQADLAFKQAPARSEDVVLYQARVNRAAANLNLAQDQYEETILGAPIAGVITEVNFAVGEQTSLSQPVIAMLTTANYEIEVDIPESDITKIKLGDKVDITLDAFTQDDIFQGTVTTINPAQTEIQEVVYYQVTVSFDAEPPAAVTAIKDQVKPGMTANLTIETNHKNQVLIIPARAVKDADGKKTVSVLENNQPREVEVSLGLRGDDGLVEVTAGLSAGQLVITFTKTQ